MKHAAGLLTVLFLVGAALAVGPIDVPRSSEPRVPAGTALTPVGFLSSQGVGMPYTRVNRADAVHTRDILVALPGFKVVVEPRSRAVELMLWGNLPELSSSPVLESAVVLHDSSVYDLDLTLLRGRIVLTNTKKSGSAKVWLRTEDTGVEFDLNEPGAQIALEMYGRWPAYIPFYRHRKAGDDPTRLWEVFVLKGDVTIKGGKTTWAMSAPPGRAYFHGDNINGPDAEGPRSVKAVPDWADPTAKPGVAAVLMAKVIAEYAGKLKGEDPGEAARHFFELSMKDKVAERGSMLRRVAVTTLAALDHVEAVIAMLGESPNPEVRSAAVIALRHWIGARGGRDDKLYDVLVDRMGYTKNEAEAIMQMLHSPFDPTQVETFETLIAYLKHRKQAVRELAHWHLTRLAPKGRDIPYDAAGPAEERAKAADAWRKLDLPEKK